MDGEFANTHTLRKEGLWQKVINISHWRAVLVFTFYKISENYENHGYDNLSKPKVTSTDTLTKRHSIYNYVFSYRNQRIAWCFNFLGFKVYLSTHLGSCYHRKSTDLNINNGSALFKRPSRPAQKIESIHICGFPLVSVKHYISMTSCRRSRSPDGRL